MKALDFQNQLADEYYASLRNTNTQHRKCVVVFSGVPGSGKSHIARAIETELQAVRISNDDIRDRITTADPAITQNDREQAKLDVVSLLLDRLLTAPNGLLVFDSSCDRPGGYDFYHSWALEHNYPVILLRINTPPKIVAQRISERGNIGYRNVQQTLADWDVWWRQWETFGKLHEPNLVITPNTPAKAAIEVVRAMI